MCHLREDLTVIASVLRRSRRMNTIGRNYKLPAICNVPLSGMPESRVKVADNHVDKEATLYHMTEILCGVDAIERQE